MIDEPIGRDAEIAHLAARLSQSGGGLDVVLLVGDPGIGKSTLWRWSLDAARRRGVRVLSSRPAETERDLAYLVLWDLLGDLAASELASLPGPRRHALEAALLVGDPGALQVDRRALGVAVATVLRSMSEQSPILIGIDDDQWMDSPSADALAFALRRLADRPIRVLLSRRAREQPSVSLEQHVDGATTSRVEVGPLSLGATQLLLRDRLGITLSRPTLQVLHRVTAGNPFHVLELGRARSRDPSRDLALPLPGETVDELLQARLDGLDQAARDAALLVAAHGRTPVELLVSLHVPPAAVASAIDTNVLERSGDVVGFTHPLLAAATYELAGGAARQAAHRRLAAVIRDPVQRARHLALGTAVPSAAVASALDDAAERARELGGPVTAASLFERAVELTPWADVDGQRRRMLDAARARLEAGDGERGRELISELLATVPSGSRRADALLVGAGLEAPAVAVAMLTEALGDASGDPRLRARIHASLAAAGRLTRGPSWADRHVQAALRLSTALADDSLLVRTLSQAAILRFDAADPGAMASARAAYDLALESGDVGSTRDPALIVGHILTWSGDAERARSWLVDRLATWRDRDEMMASNLLWYLSLVELWAGHWTEANARSDDSLDISTLYGIELPQDHLPAALLALHRGAFDVARQHSQRALTLAQGMVLPAHLAVLATIELWTGRPDQAVEGFAEAEAAADARGFREPAMRWWRAEYGEALLRVGRTEDAERLVTDQELDARRIGRRREVANALRSRGLIATAEGDLALAGTLLDEAAIEHEAAGDRFGWARARLAAGVVHRRSLRKRLARLAFESAVAAFSELGAASWVEASRAELSRLGGRQRHEGMSPSETRVAALVAEGRTNREIAAALFITERTVASHLTHVYAKLGVQSRTQLARLVNEDRGKVPKS